MSEQDTAGQPDIIELTPEAAARVRWHQLRSAYETFWELFAAGVLAKDWEHLPEYDSFEAWRDTLTAIGKPTLDQLAKVVEILGPTMTLRQIAASTGQSTTRVGNAAARVPDRDTANPKASAAREREQTKKDEARKERERVERQSARDRAKFKAEAESTPQTPAEAPVGDEHAEGHQDATTTATPAEKPRQRSNWPKDTTLESVTFNRGTAMTLTFADGSVMGASNGMFNKENRDGRKYQEVVKLMADMWQTRWVELDQAVREIYREHLEGETK